MNTSTSLIWTPKNVADDAVALGSDAVELEIGTADVVVLVARSAAKRVVVVIVISFWVVVVIHCCVLGQLIHTVSWQYMFLFIGHCSDIVHVFVVVLEIYTIYAYYAFAMHYLLIDY